MGVISDVVKSLLGRSADTIIEDLSSNSRHLLELDQLLRFKMAKIDIYSFYELLPLNPLSRPVSTTTSGSRVTKQDNLRTRGRSSADVQAARPQSLYLRNYRTTHP